MADFKQLGRELGRREESCTNLDKLLQKTINTYSKVEAAELLRGFADTNRHPKYVMEFLSESKKLTKSLLPDLEQIAKQVATKALENARTEGCAQSVINYLNRMGYDGVSFAANLGGNDQTSHMVKKFILGGNRFDLLQKLGETTNSVDVAVECFELTNPDRLLELVDRFDISTMLYITTDQIHDKDLKIKLLRKIAAKEDSWDTYNAAHEVWQLTGSLDDWHVMDSKENGLSAKHPWGIIKEGFACLEKGDFIGAYSLLSSVEHPDITPEIAIKAYEQSFKVQGNNHHNLPHIREHFDTDLLAAAFMTTKKHYSTELAFDVLRHADTSPGVYLNLYSRVKGHPAKRYILAVRANDQMRIDRGRGPAVKYLAEQKGFLLESDWNENYEEMKNFLMESMEPRPTECYKLATRAGILDDELRIKFIESYGLEHLKEFKHADFSDEEFRTMCHNDTGMKPAIHLYLAQKSGLTVEEVKELA